jgi:hypothetical protein
VHHWGRQGLEYYPRHSSSPRQDVLREKHHRSSRGVPRCFALSSQVMLLTSLRKTNKDSAYIEILYEHGHGQIIISNTRCVFQFQQNISRGHVVF